MGALVGEQLGMNSPQFSQQSWGSQFSARLLTGFAAGATTAVARGGKVAIQQIATDAFGNALGSSLADALGPQNTPQESFRSGEIAQQNAQAASVQGVGPWSHVNHRNGSDVESDRVSTLNGFVQAFAIPVAVGPGEGTLLAAGPGYTGGLGKIDWHGEQVERAMRLAEESMPSEHR